MGLINTGVDRLMSLINERGRVLVKDAARELSVSEKLILDWAEFLEEEGFLKFEYTFSKVFIIKKELSQDDIKAKDKEYSSQKEAFVRKAQGLQQIVDRDSLGLEDIKKELDDIYKEINSKKQLIQSDLNVLKKYEESKTAFDSEINLQKQKFLEMIKGAEAKVQDNYDQVNKLLQTIKNEEKMLIERADELEEMKRVEEQLKNYIHDSLEFLNKTMQKIDATQKEISESKNILRSLQSDAAKLEKELINYDDRVVFLY